MMPDDLLLRAAIDANVLVVAPLDRGTPTSLIHDAWDAAQFQLIVSEHVLDEVARAH